MPQNVIAYLLKKSKNMPRKDFSMNVHNISHDSQNLEATQMSINRRLDEQIAVKSRNRISVTQQ